MSYQVNSYMAELGYCNGKMIEMFF